MLGGYTFRIATAIVGAFQEFFGKYSPQSTVIARKRDRLKKLLSTTLVDSIKAMEGVVSNARQQALLASLPTLDNLDVANAQLFGDQMRSLLDEADISGFAVGGREFIEQFIENPLAGLESITPDFDPSIVFDAATDKASQGFDAATAFATEKAGQGIDVATAFAKDTAAAAQPIISKAAEKARAGLATATEIAKLKLDDLKQIDFKDVENWTEEQKAALDKRLKELGF